MMMTSNVGQKKGIKRDSQEKKNQESKLNKNKTSFKIRPIKNKEKNATFSGQKSPFLSSQI